MQQNIVWQKSMVSYEDRCNILGQKGLVVWFTGLSGSGKSTIAIEVEKMLAEKKRVAYLLDGDNIRHGINSDLGFSDEDRNENIRRIAEIAALYRSTGIITLVSFISPFSAMRDFAREKAGKDAFIEIYVSTDFETCAKRDPKGLYKKQPDNFTGATSGYEKPLNPDIILDTVNKSIEECAKIVFDRIVAKIIG